MVTKGLKVSKLFLAVAKHIRSKPQIRVDGYAVNSTYYIQVDLRSGQAHRVLKQKSHTKV